MMPQVPHTCIDCGHSFLEWAYRGYKRCPDCRIFRPPFTKEELEILYLQDGLSCSKIAIKTNKTSQQVKNWLKRYEIPTRKPIKTRYPNRSDPPPKEVLYNLYWIRYLSYVEIAKIYKVDPTAVPYWLRKYDIPRRSLWETRRKGNNPKEPNSEELQDLYCNQGLGTEDIGKIFGISASLISRRLKKFGIQPRLPGYNQIRHIASDGHEVLSGLELVVDNWLSDHGIEHIYEPSLPFGGKADFLVGNIYIEVWGINHNVSYLTRTNSKKRQYKKYGLALIGLIRKDIPKNLDKKLNPLIISSR